MAERVSQEVVETVFRPAVTPARVSHEVVEVVYVAGAAGARTFVQIIWLD
ncbi:MAG TPA: hypothetical protein VFH63_04000 [candidate division Zixibacteria bacterium]|nr:hypothetical protein [candidate division Zixibacteria bacterium]